MKSADSTQDAGPADRLAMLEHQCTTILVLSAINLFMNLAMILASVLVMWL